MSTPSDPDLGFRSQQRSSKRPTGRISNLYSMLPVSAGETFEEWTELSQNVIQSSKVSSSDGR
jgi:hypothetical protein